MLTSEPNPLPRAGGKPEPYLPGEIIENKYRLVRPLGEGGMGTVWVAHNVVLDVHVAIKLINLRDGNSQRSSDRLLQEARASARLGHPAIVRVFDFGRTRRGDPFVVMELIRGVTLADHAQHEQRLPAIRAVQLMLPIADALSVAHSKGIVHRDVKPDNVILASDEAGRIQPKLLDFGIASMVETSTRLTLEGTVLGTPDYMSPEQARGSHDMDHRSDVWSFSVMLYELLTGHLPFNGRNYNALLYSIVNEQPKPIMEFAAGDKQLWLVLERGLRKDPADRWETMRVMGEALALWLYERGVREDVCAASLKTSWLEAGLTGVRIEVSSVAPGPDETGAGATPPTGRPEFDTAPESGFFELPGTSGRRQEDASNAALGSRARKRRAALRWAVLSLIGLLASALVVWFVARSPEAVDEPKAFRAATTPKTAAQTKASPIAARDEVVSQAERSEPSATPERVAPRKAPPGASRPKRSEPALRAPIPAAAVEAPPPAPPAQKAHPAEVDFGF
ncbi:MAG TPA: serine/threonine-protein kinase [Polyangiaceae bacterium]